MKLYFKQRFLSWFDSYDIYNENGEVEFRVEGELSWGHLLKIYDYYDNHVATIKERIMTLLPAYEIYKNDKLEGLIRKEFSFFKPYFMIEYREWEMEGDLLEWEYRIVNRHGREVARLSKEVFNLVDTYVIDVREDDDALDVLLVVLAIDIDKCRSK